MYFLWIMAMFYFRKSTFIGLHTAMHYLKKSMYSTVLVRDDGLAMFYSTCASLLIGWSEEVLVGMMAIFYLRKSVYLSGTTARFYLRTSTYLSGRMARFYLRKCMYLSGTMAICYLMTSKYLSGTRARFYLRKSMYLSGTRARFNLRKFKYLLGQGPSST